MKAIWKGSNGYVHTVDKELVRGAEYTGPDRVVQEHIDNGLAEPVKSKKAPAPKPEDK